MVDTESFSKRLRKETRDIHKISDALINAKLAFGECIQPFVYRIYQQPFEGRAY